MVPTAQLGENCTLPSCLCLLPSTVLWIQLPNLKGGYLIIAGYFKFRIDEGEEKETFLKIMPCLFGFFLFLFVCLFIYIYIYGNSTVLLLFTLTLI